jgi:hypothetical protein
MAPKTQQSRSPEAVGREVQAEITAAVTAAMAVSAQSAALQGAGYTAASMYAAIAALLRPLATARITLLARSIEQRWNDPLPTSIRPEVVREILDREIQYELDFARRSAKRIVRSMEKASERGDDLDDAFREALSREARFERMRQAAVQRRITLRIQEEWVRSLSPEGAYWVIDPTKKTHTADCIAMAGKVWSWSVLAIIRPSNRHNLCGCTLIPKNMAAANGLPNAEVVRSALPAAARREH